MRANKHPALNSVHPDWLYALELSLLSDVCEDVGSDYSRAVLRAYTPGSFDPNSVAWPSFDDAFPQHYLVYNLMRKNPRHPGHDADYRRNAALRKFWECEAMNHSTNQRLAGAMGHPLIVEARSILCSVLGPICKADITHIYSHCRPGKGGTTTLKRDDADRTTKAQIPWAVTPRLKPLVEGIYDRLEIDHYVQTVETVPKDSFVDRCILKQPDANIAFQRAVGQLLRQRLNTRTFLRPSDQSRNRHLASNGLDWQLATIDLSSASDTISKQLVRLLFCEEALLPWLHLLQLGRVDTVWKDGHEVELNMWSAMGNGYTWELETLIFYAVSLAAMRLAWKECRFFEHGVYGDDIVVPVDCVDQVCTALEFCGFSVNKRKSFWQGDFRESCGTDWFRGKDVRPFFLRANWDEYKPKLAYIFEYRNQLERYSHAVHGGWQWTHGAINRLDNLLLELGINHADFWQDPEIPGDEGLISYVEHPYDGYRYGVPFRKLSRLRQISDVVRRAESTSYRAWLFYHSGHGQPRRTSFFDIEFVTILQNALKERPETTEHHGQTVMTNIWSVRSVITY